MAVSTWLHFRICQGRKVNGDSDATEISVIAIDLNCEPAYEKKIYLINLSCARLWFGVVYVYFICIMFNDKIPK